MKRPAIAILATLLAAGLAWLAIRSGAGTRISLSAVDAAVRTHATSSGAVFLEFRSASDSIRSERMGFANRIYQSVSGNPLLMGSETYILASGGDTLVVTVFHRSEDVREVEIHPKSKNPAPARNLQRALTDSFPGLNCQVKSP